ncbi:MAG: DNA methyltransferase [Candidatus Acidiferrales bacterium]
MAHANPTDLFSEPAESPRKSTNPQSRANDLSGKEWTKYSISVWNDIRKTSEEAKLGHPAMFPGSLVERLLLSFTKGTEKAVLDPFCGSGATLVAAKRMGKHGIGFEVAKEYYDLSVRRLRQTQSRLFVPSDGPEAQVHHADARDMERFVPASTIDICITSPPYWDILSRKRSADYKAVRDYAEGQGDVSKIADYRKFLDELANIFRNVYSVLKPRGFCIVVVMDIRKQDKLYPFHSDLAARLCSEDVGFFLDDTIIWDRRQEYNNLRPLGYPTTFRINKIHEYILIFRKPK